MLEEVAIANESNRCERCKGERALFFLLIPGEEVLDGAFIATDGPRGTVIGQQVAEPSL